MNKRKKIYVGISAGDPSGVGIEVIFKTFLDNRMMDFCTPIIFGSQKIILHHKKILGFSDLHINIIKNINAVKEKKINLLDNSKYDVDINIGTSSSYSGKYAIESIEQACDAIQKNKIDLLVTAPINKLAIQENIKTFIGHTEFLEKMFSGQSLMLMCSEIMKIGFVTGHTSLKNVTKSINTQKIIKKTKQLNNCLIQDFGVRKPKIAVLGINPHAGEEGMLGNEEKETIIPAINDLNESGIMAFGPYPADSFFIIEKLKAFDGILAMYHDQGLIPFKTFSFEDGVNYTAGLNIIRTSPVHGTAYNIAGHGKANENSFRQAIFLACDIFKKRKEYDSINLHALKN